MQEQTEKLRRILSASVQANACPGILFSGGLDTAILAYLACDNYGGSRKIKAITVNFSSYGEDVKFAQSLSRILNIEHYHKSVNVQEAVDAIPKVIRVLRSFDPALPNDLVVYFALKEAKGLGIDKVMTGDGSDELFAGYPFMQKITDLQGYLQKIARKMVFSSNDLGRFFKIGIAQPFLEKQSTDFALAVNPELKIREEKGRLRGKWILRKAFEGLLPQEIIWQSKRPLESGSGMTRLRNIISARVSDEEFQKDNSAIRFISKEHFYYYKIYREQCGAIPRPKKKERACPGCGAGIAISAFHCRTCGHVLEDKL